MPSAISRSMFSRKKRMRLNEKRRLNRTTKAATLIGRDRNRNSVETAP
jgi:hypothetical protein